MIEVAFDGENRREEAGGLTQWDYGRLLRIHGLKPRDEELFEFHFALEGDSVAFRCKGEINREAGYITAEIPAGLLKTGKNLNTYIYRTDPEKGMTIYTVYLVVKKRPKPEDYSAPADKNIIRQLQDDMNKKADGLQLTDDGLQLFSGDVPIGSPVDIPAGSVEIISIPDTEIDEIMKGEENNGEIS